MTTHPSPQPRVDTSGHAITALTFAVLGWLVLPVLGPIIALVYAARARRDLAVDPYLRGDGFVVAARTISIVQLVLVLFVAVAGVALGLAAGWSIHEDTGPTRSAPRVVTQSSAPDVVPTGTFVSSGRLVSLIRGLPAPSAELGGVFRVRSITDYAWADGGPHNTVGTLRFNLTPRPPDDATLVRLMVFRSSRMGLADLSATAGNFGSDNLAPDGQPGSCWAQDGDDVCEVLIGRVLVEVRSPTNSYGSLEMARTVVRWLRSRLPLEASLTARA